MKRKKVIIKYRSIAVVGLLLVFNLISSLLVYSPEGQMFNASPLTVIEWLCDIVAFIGILTGVMMMCFDIHENEKRKIKEAILEANEELKNDKDATVSIKSKDD